MIVDTRGVPGTLRPEPERNRKKIFSKNRNRKKPEKPEPETGIENRKQGAKTASIYEKAPGVFGTLIPFVECMFGFFSE